MENYGRIVNYYSEALDWLHPARTIDGVKVGYSTLFLSLAVLTRAY